MRERERERERKKKKEDYRKREEMMYRERKRGIKGDEAVRGKRRRLEEEGNGA